MSGMKWVRRAAIVTAVCGGGALAAVTLIPNQEKSPIRNPSWFNWINLGADKVYYHFGRHIRKLTDPEKAHVDAIAVASSSRTVRGILGLLPPQFDYANLHSEPFEERKKQQSPSENTSSIIDSSRSSASEVPLKRLHFNNPVGLAAGFDKHAEAIDGLLDMGFGFTEIGSVTPLPQPGNPKPRVFRLEQDRAIINRYGFNSKGADAVQQQLNNRLHTVRSEGLLGVNLGKNKISDDAVRDYEIGIDKLARFADYIVGLRNLQQKSELSNLLSSVKKRRDSQFREAKKSAPPLLVKIAPDLTEQDREDIAEVCLSVGLDGLIISNTTIARPPELRSPEQIEVGGLSGAPLKHVSTDLIRDMYKRTQGRVVIIGVGGVENGVDAYAKIKAGASLVQVYSSFAYEGPYVLHIIKRDLSRLITQDGFNSISEAVGSDHRQKRESHAGEKSTLRSHS